MRPYKMLGALLGLAVLASAAAAPAALAAKPSFLGTMVVGLKFKGKSTKTIVVSLPPDLECKADTNKGELTGEKTLTIALTLEGCKEAEEAVNSPGAGKEEVVVPTFSGELCYINEAAKEVGIYFKLNNEGFTVERPLKKEKDVYKGQFIGEAENVNISQALQDIKVPEKAIEKCGPAGSEKFASLSVSINGAKPVIAEFESFEELSFEKAIEING